MVDGEIRGGGQVRGVMVLEGNRCTLNFETLNRLFHKGAIYRGVATFKGTMTIPWLKVLLELNKGCLQKLGHRGSQPLSEYHQSKEGVVRKYPSLFLLPSSHFLPESWLNPTTRKAEDLGAIGYRGPGQGKEGPRMDLEDNQKVTSTRRNIPNDVSLN